MDYSFLLALALILMSTKLLGIASRKVHMPAVVGALLAGVFLGPSCTNVVIDTDFLQKIAEIGVIILMFLAGLETDLGELKENGIASLVIAGIGVVVPIAGGFLTYYFFFDCSDLEQIMKAVFVGVVLTATSVSITVETLRELGKLQGRMGTTILGAAIIDDIIGIIVLTVITSLSGDSDAHIAMVLLKIAAFFAFVLLIGGVVFFVSKHLIKRVKRRRRISIYTLTFCFMLSYMAEHYFGIADITGAYFAGIILCNFGIRQYIDEKITVLSYLFFSPVFFASIGIKTHIGAMSNEFLIFSIALLIVAILSKVIGCYVGAKICKFSNKEALAIGVGMVSRGEVALIVAQKGAQIQLISEELFPAIVFVVIVTTLITPVMLKLTLKNKKSLEG